MEAKEPGRGEDFGDISIPKLHYFMTGSQYYLVSRFGAFAHLMPVCGNLYHHAIEFFLKGQLCDTITEEALKKLNHKLVELWEQFKADTQDPALDQYDQCIAELDRFDFIRYPGEVLKHGLQGSIGFGKENPNAGKQALFNMPIYELSVDELDELIIAIFGAAQVNTYLLRVQSIHDDERDYMFRNNKTGLLPAPRHWENEDELK